MILGDLLEKVPRLEIVSRYGVTRAIVDRIKSGKWFQEQDARDAKKRGKTRKGYGPCKPCGGVIVKLPCLACQIRALANGRRSRYSEKTLHAEVQSDGTCQMTREPDGLVFQLSPEEERARKKVRAEVFGG